MHMSLLTIFSVMENNEMLKTLGLELNPKSQIIKLKAGITFVGFHYYPDGTITLDNSKKRGYKRKFTKLCRKVESGEKKLEDLEKSYESWKKHASFANKIKYDYFEKRLASLRKERK